MISSPQLFLRRRLQEQLVNGSMMMPTSFLLNSSTLIVANTTTLNGDTISNSSTTASTYFGDYSDASSAGTAFCLGWILITLLCYFSVPSIPSEEYRRERQTFFQRQAEARRRREQRLARLADPIKRRAGIEKCLTTKRIVSADAEGNLTLGEPTEEEQNGDDNHSSGHFSIEEGEEESTCVICLENFRVGDVVAWKRSFATASSVTPIVTGIETDTDKTTYIPVKSDCFHVFHRDCIVSWLENKHDDCPSCRKVILQFDDEEENDVEKQLVFDHDDANNNNNIDMETTVEAAASESNLFVIMHGLVSRVRRASYSLVGETIDVSTCDPSLISRRNSVSSRNDDMSRHLPQPCSLRRAVSTGRGHYHSPSDQQSVLPRTLSFVRRRSVVFQSTNSTIKENNLPPALALRRAVSVGPGASPTRMTFDKKDKENGNSFPDCDMSLEVPQLLTDIVPFQRSSSSSSAVTRRPSRSGVDRNEPIHENICQGMNNRSFSSTRRHSHLSANDSIEFSVEKLASIRPDRMKSRTSSLSSVQQRRSRMSSYDDSEQSDEDDILFFTASYNNYNSSELSSPWKQSHGSANESYSDLGDPSYHFDDTREDLEDIDS